MVNNDQGLLVGGLEPWNFDWLSIQLGMSSSQLTNSMIFQRGRYTTNQFTSEQTLCLRLNIRWAIVVAGFLSCFCWNVLLNPHWALSLTNLNTNGHVVNEYDDASGSPRVHCVFLFKQIIICAWSIPELLDLCKQKEFIYMFASLVGYSCYGPGVHAQC
jgi:hypothetical protein